MKRSMLVVTAVVVAMSGVVGLGVWSRSADRTGVVAAAGSTDWIETFSDPAAAQQRFVTQLHTFGGATSWQGDHDMACGAPTTSRTVNLPAGDGPSKPVGETMYFCKDHMMTSYNGDGYAEIDFSPKGAFDGVSRVCWDQNMTELGDRKWTQFAVVPESTFQAHGRRLDYIEPGFEFGPGAQGVAPLPSDVFMFKLLRGSTQIYNGTANKDENFLGFQTSDKARRFRTCVTDLDNGTVRVELERESTTETRIQRGSIPNGTVRVIFQDVSYNPPKSAPSTPTPFTWHWDNIIITSGATTAPPAPVVTTVPPVVTTVPPVVTTVPPVVTTVPPVVTTVPPVVTTVPPVVTTVPPVVTTVPPVVTTVPPVVTTGSRDWIEAFSDPAAAQQRFVTQLHTFGGATSWQGDHDMACGAPTTSRTVNLPAGDGPSKPVGETMYFCKDHMMTSYNGDGYAQIDFSPKGAFDGVSRVCWDQNMTELGDRKWTQFAVVPESTFQAHGRRLDYIEPGFEFGPGAQGVAPLPSDVFMFKLLRGSTQVYNGTANKDENFQGFQTSDKARRFRTCVTDLDNGTVRVELERESTTETRIQRGSIPNGTVRVIFQDVSYNPPKSAPSTPTPFTWHWDNIIITSGATTAPPAPV